VHDGAHGLLGGKGAKGAGMALTGAPYNDPYIGGCGDPY